MNQTGLLDEIAAICKCEVSVNINRHRNYYESVADYFEDRDSDTTPDVMAEMIKRDTIIEVQVYPSTPVGFYYFAHWDLETALRDAFNALTEKGSVVNGR